MTNMTLHEMIGFLKHVKTMHECDSRVLNERLNDFARSIDCDYSKLKERIYEITGHSIETCDDCGELAFADSMCEAQNGDSICRACRIDNYTCCADCNELAPDHDLTTVDNGDSVCESCRSDHYTWSDRTDSYIHDNDWNCCDHEDSCGCNDDYEDEESDYFPPVITGNPESLAGRILNYSFNVCTALRFLDMPNPGAPVSHSVKTLMLGVELEVESISGEILDNARLVGRAAKNPKDSQYEALLKSDGSLQNGFEIVSAPMVPARHLMADSLWDRVTTCEARRNLRSSDTRTCGLHVHVSRAALSSLTIGKLVYFFNAPSNARFVKSIAGRDLDQSNWAKLKTKKITGNDGTLDRYEIVNLCPRQTIEIRAFKGTLKIETIKARIDFVTALLAWLPLASCEALGARDFIAWADLPQNRKAHPWLSKWLQSRNMIARPKPRAVQEDFNPWIEPQLTLAPLPSFEIETEIAA